MKTTGPQDTLDHRIDLPLTVPFTNYAAAYYNLMMTPEVRGPLSKDEKKYTKIMRTARKEAIANVRALMIEASKETDSSSD